MPSVTRRFLVCASEQQAKVVDATIFARIRDEFGVFGSCWSGIYTNGTSFGVEWDAPASDLFVPVQDFPGLTIVEDAGGAWRPAEPVREVV